MSWWGKILSFFFSFFPSVTLWIFNDKTFRHHFLPLVPSYLVAPTFSLLTDQFGYPTQHLCPMPPFLLSWLSSSSPKKKKTVRFKLCFFFVFVYFWFFGSCCMKALRDAFRVGIFIFFTLVVHGSRKRLGQHTVGRPIIIKTRQHATTQDGILSLALLAFYLPSISPFFCCCCWTIEER